jgi:hypothetical protein
MTFAFSINSTEPIVSGYRAIVKGVGGLDRLDGVCYNEGLEYYFVQHRFNRIFFRLLSMATE